MVRGGRLHGRLDAGVALAAGLRRGIAAAALAGLVWAVFAPSLDHGWLNYDDDVYVTANPQLASGLTREGVRWAFTTLHGSNWFPLTWLSWMLDVERQGLDARGFHATNLGLHALATALLFLALCGLTGRPGRSAFVAAVFGLHPLHVESVAWVAARKDPLSGVFFMAALLAYTPGAGRDRPPAQLALVALCLALGLMAKQTLVTLPCVLLLLDYWPLGRLRSGHLRRVVLEKLPLFALAAAGSLAAVWAQRSAGVVADLEQLPLAARLGNALLACATYLGQALWPARLAVFYPHPETGLAGGAVAAALALLVGLSVLAWRARRWQPAVLVGWLWYLGTLVPTLGLVQVGSQARADRYTYLPLVGLALALAWGVPEALARLLPDARRRRAALGLGAAACIAALALGTRLQLRHWRDSEALMRHALAVTGDNFIAHAYLGSALLARGATGEAIVHWRESARLAPGYATVANNLAWLLATQRDPHHRDPAGAVELASRAVELSGEQPAVLDTLAAAYASAGRFAEASRLAERALALARARGESDLAQQIAARAALYRSGRAYVER